MSDLSYEIRCPACKSVVPADAPRCPSCAATARSVGGVGTRRLSAVPTTGAPAQGAAAAAEGSRQLENVSTMKLKDYHRLVRANYGSVERRGAAAVFGGPLGPILLIVALALVVAAAIAFGWLS